MNRESYKQEVFLGDGVVHYLGNNQEQVYLSVLPASGSKHKIELLLTIQEFEYAAERAKILNNRPMLPRRDTLLQTIKRIFS